MLNASSDSTEVVERVLMADWTNSSLENAGVLHSWSAGEKTTEIGRPDDRTKGALKDSVLAHMWFNIAGANGKADARERRDELERDMTRAEVS